MIAITEKLRPSLRSAAKERMEREVDITLTKLMAYLISKQRDEQVVVETEAEAVFVAAGGRREVQRGQQHQRGGTEVEGSRGECHQEVGELLQMGDVIIVGRWSIG